MPVLKTNNKKYYSNKKIHAYEASIYTKENIDLYYKNKPRTYATVPNYWHIANSKILI